VKPENNYVPKEVLNMCIPSGTPAPSTSCALRGSRVRVHAELQQADQVGARVRPPSDSDGHGILRAVRPALREDTQRERGRGRRQDAAYDIIFFRCERRLRGGPWRSHLATPRPPPLSALPMHSSLTTHRLRLWQGQVHKGPLRFARALHCRSAVRVKVLSASQAVRVKTWLATKSFRSP
jgi:hypothetical protein